MSSGTISCLNLLVAGCAFWTEQELEQARLENNPSSYLAILKPALASPHSIADEVIAYFVKYRQLCDFLAGLQVTTPGQNFLAKCVRANLQRLHHHPNRQYAGSHSRLVAIRDLDAVIRPVTPKIFAMHGCIIPVWPARREEGGGYYAAAQLRLGI